MLEANEKQGLSCSLVATYAHLSAAYLEDVTQRHCPMGEPMDKEGL